ncbi:hypothetical protein EON65_32675 [archaeon]|nr:MAG: hypothetical protein EON65_32675 [archaeon]
MENGPNAQDKSCCSPLCFSHHFFFVSALYVRDREMVCLIAGCLGGLEGLVVEELKESFGSAILYIKVISEQPVKMGEAACGKVWISLDDVSVGLEAIRSVQFWLVALYEGDLCGDGLSDALPLLIPHLNHSALTQALEAWRGLLLSSTENSGVTTSAVSDFSFWTRCVRSGEHKFTSVDLASSLGGHIKDTMQWNVDVKDPTLMVSVIVAYRKVCIGLLLPIGAKASPKSHLPDELHPPILHVSHTTNLRPSTAYLMLKLANMQPYEVIVDAMCGPGAGLLEGAYGHHGVSIGGDVNIDLKAPLLQATKLATSMSNHKTIAEVSGICITYMLL